MTAIISSQTLSVCAAPVNDFSAVGKDNLLRYYEENFDVAKYKATYKDLRDAFGENADDSMYLKHYLEHGEPAVPFSFVECMDILRQQNLQQLCRRS